MKSAQYHTGQILVYDARGVACALGGNVIGRDKVAAPGPGHSPRDRSLTVMLDSSAPDGFVCFSHAGDAWDVCKDYVRQRLGLPAWQPGDGRDRHVEPARLKAFDRAAVNAESERRRHSEDDMVRIACAVAIWDEAGELRRTPVEAYLATRALVLGDDIAGSVLRFHPACPWRHEDTGTTIFIPALIAAFRSVDDDAITAVHRIRLDQPQHWPKTQRRMLGIVHRSAVKLAPAGDTLHVGEGVETCLAAQRLGYTPAWALGSVGAIAKFPVLDGVACLRLLGETGTASAAAVEQCAQRWHSAGRRVQMVMSSVGSDLNDELMAAAP